jgi:hypothetical protein
MLHDFHRDAREYGNAQTEHDGEQDRQNAQPQSVDMDDAAPSRRIAHSLPLT